MFIQVRLLKGFQEPLLYEVPKNWDNQSLVGKLVRVPIQKSLRSALVMQQFATKPTDCIFTIKQAHAIEPFPADPYYFKFIHQLSAYYQVEPLYLIKRIQQFLVDNEMEDQVVSSHNPEKTLAHVTLTNEQQTVVDFLTPYIAEPAYVPTVLHGVTGSGKTEIYKNLIIKNFAHQKNTLLMLPEVTLAIQFEKLMRAQLPSEIPIFSFHSATTPKNKRLLWHALLTQQPILIIGVHLPILLPLPNLGMIIIDEEHEVGYQEKKHPKINSKDAAIWCASIHKIPIILGSATPSINSLYNVHNKGWHFFQLKNRFAGTFPTIKTVFLTDKNSRKSFWISKQLESAIKDRLLKNEQTIIFINRRGFSFFVQCKACSFIFQCKNCSVSLTLHADNLLTCHYCAISMQLPQQCPPCQASDAQFLKKGIGTQQVVTILEKLFPQARIARADMDTTLKKKVWQQTVLDFEQGNLDILVGTQTITKGFHFPGVTLVGILWADLNLHFPMYNAAETTLQQLIQVAGRAGRQRPDSQVIVQTMIDHAIFQYLNEIDYLSFYDAELEKRTMLNYPPCMRLVELELKNSDPHSIEREATHLMHTMMEINTKKELQLQLLGPAKPPVHKIKNTYARKIYIKGSSIQNIIILFQSINTYAYKSHIFFTPNPVT
ncbi:MAG: primosomal protein N' [Candidatus Dependentiae bacterium]|nr:primosomal protein N' [Candidatus Dependentiae bacterium]